jgi:hypothetical protein
MSAAQLHPDFGEPQWIEAPEVDGGYIGNLAAVAEIARNGDTPQSRMLYRALCDEWRATETLPLTAKARTMRVMSKGLATIGLRLAAD